MWSGGKSLSSGDRQSWSKLEKGAQLGQPRKRGELEATNSNKVVVSMARGKIVCSQCVSASKHPLKPLCPPCGAGVGGAGVAPLALPCGVPQGARVAELGQESRCGHMG